MAKKAKEKKPGDAVKSYVLVMTVLVVVMAVLYVVLNNRRKSYEAANATLQRDMRVVERGPDDPPRTITDLAYEVEQLSRKFREASGGGGLDFVIPQEMMRAVATKAGLRRTYAGPVQTEKDPNYRTIHQKFDYEAMHGGPPEIWRFLTLLYNVESRGRYRVSEMTWVAADNTDDAKPPYDLIKNARLQVSLRGPRTLE